MAGHAARRKGPSKAFLTRDAQRRLLTAHFALFLASMIGAFFANRTFSPDVFWVQWVALVWGLLLGAHGVQFARSTLATMGTNRETTRE